MTLLRLAVTAAFVHTAATSLQSLRTIEPGQGLCSFAKSAGKTAERTAEGTAERTAEITLWPTGYNSHYTGCRAPGAAAASQNTTADLSEAAERACRLRKSGK